MKRMKTTVLFDKNQQDVQCFASKFDFKDKDEKV